VASIRQRLRQAFGYPAGTVGFASKKGQLTGNHFLTIAKGQENLLALGTKALWESAQDILFERLESSLPT
jgi:hypothetical protein